jgi:hypothetical protein
VYTVIPLTVSLSMVAVTCSHLESENITWKIPEKDNIHIIFITVYYNSIFLLPLVNLLLYLIYKLL